MVFRIQFLLLLLSVPTHGFGQRIEYTRLERQLIEARMQMVGGKNSERADSLRKLFQQAGCSNDKFVEQKVKGSKLPNLICTMEGRADSSIIVGAHYDAVSAGKGIVDNWSGAALLPSLFQSLRLKPLQHVFIFIGFSDEEVGLVGSSYYARKLDREQVARTKAMVNLDSLGLSSTKVWLSHSDKNLTEFLARVAGALKLPLAYVNVERVGTTDSESFARRKIPSITIHSVTQETLPILHSARDNFDAFRMDDYYDTYRLLAAYLVFLDSALE